MDIAVPEADVPGKFDELLAKALAGEQVVITRGGLPIARLTPLNAGLGEFAHWGPASGTAFAPEPDDAAVNGP
jgi:prevent-host-death family protein